MRGWLRRVENAARGNLASFELLGGGRYYYDPASTELILHIFDCLHAQGGQGTARPHSSRSPATGATWAYSPTKPRPL